jgi:hypothetical protein
MHLATLPCAAKFGPIGALRTSSMPRKSSRDRLITRPFSATRRIRRPAAAVLWSRSLHSLSESVGACVPSPDAAPPTATCRRCRTRTATAARVREDVGRRLARPPEFRQLIAIGRPVVPHVVADEGRQVRANAVPAVALHRVLVATREENRRTIRRRRGGRASGDLSAASARSENPSPTSATRPPRTGGLGSSRRTAALSRPTASPSTHRSRTRRRRKRTWCGSRSRMIAPCSPSRASGRHSTVIAARNPSRCRGRIRSMVFSRHRRTWWSSRSIRRPCR